MESKIKKISYAISEAWYPIARSSDLKDKPISRKILGQDIVLFRLNGVCQALVDECPHRRVQLSLGSVEGDGLRCVYHGWKFSGDGGCIEVPNGGKNCIGRLKIPFHDVIENQNLIWIYSKPNIKAKEKPHFIENYRCNDYKIFEVKPFIIKASIANCLENFVDVSHTRFLHSGLGRVGKMNEIKTLIKTEQNKISVEYINEPQPRGLLFKVLTPRSESIKHIDRLILPGIVQSEYHFNSRFSSLVQDYLTPVDENTTMVFSFASIKLPMPNWLFNFLGKLLSNKILKQDKEILENQAGILNRSNSGRFINSESDIYWKFIYENLINQNFISEPEKLIKFKI